MTAFLASLSSCPRDFKLAFGFLTRLPGPLSLPAASGELGRALRLAPLVGLVVGVCGALVTWIAVGGLRMPPLPAALLTIGVTIWITGALHEDGLAVSPTASAAPSSVAASSLSCATAASAPTACWR